jgi:lysophospholipase L1-like esterase
VSASLFAAKLALGPILLPQARWLQKTALRLPEAAGERQGVVGEGAPKLRVLVVGDSSAAGVGVADQAQALALPLAHHLSRTLYGAVAWQLVAQSGVNTAQARDLASEAKLQPADVVVVVLGVNDVSSQTSPSRFTEELGLLWDEVRHRTGARWAIFCGLPPMGMLTAVPHPLRWYLGRYSDVLDAAVQGWTRENGHGFFGLRWASDPKWLAEDGFHPGPELYPQWAERLAQFVASRPDLWARP